MDKVVTDSSRTLEEKKGRSLERIRTQASMAFTVARYRNSALALLKRYRSFKTVQLRFLGWKAMNMILMSRSGHRVSVIQSSRTRSDTNYDVQESTWNFSRKSTLEMALFRPEPII